MDWRVGDVPLVTTSGLTTRILMPGAVYQAPAPPKNRKDDDTHGGTADSFGVVYVNELAREAVNAEPPIQFSRGAIIVRERLASLADLQPQHLTVMIKRARGFNGAANDWEFLTVDGNMTKIEQRQRKGSCLECHVSQRDRDFVYREPPQ